MKKLYMKIFVFLPVVCVALLMLDLLSMRPGFGYDIMAKITASNEYIHLGTSEINPYIAKVRTEDESTKLILGDSVGHQLFNGGGEDLQSYNQDICIVGSNGAITMEGQFLLAKEYLEHHEKATDIYLVVLPESLGRKFEPAYGYQYAVMPFVQSRCLEGLDENTKEQIKEAYGPFALRSKFVELIDQSAVNEKLFLNYLKKYRKPYVVADWMGLADQYVVKLVHLCEEKNVNFHLYPCPMSETKRASWETIKQEYDESELYRFFSEYMNQVCFYPEEQFGDGTHFVGEYNTRDYFDSVIREAYADTELIRQIHLAE